MKINRPEQVPTAIFCAVNEDTPNVKPDIDVNIDALADMAKVIGKDFFRNHEHRWRQRQENRQKHGEAHPHGHHSHRGHGHGPHRGRGGCPWRRGFCGRGTPAWGAQPQTTPQPEATMDPTKWLNMMTNCPAMQNKSDGPVPVCEAGDSWNRKSAIVTNPQEVLIAHRGQTVFATVTIKNDTQFSYKKGCSLQSWYQGEAKYALKEVIQPIEFEVNAGQEFTLNIPLEVTKDAKFTSKTIKSEYLAELVLVGPENNPFGEQILIKFKVVEKVDEGEFYQRAMDIFEGIADKEEGLFDQVVECLKEADNDVQKAKNILLMRRSIKKAEEEDLYS